MSEFLNVQKIWPQDMMGDMTEDKIGGMVSPFPVVFDGFGLTRAAFTIGYKKKSGRAPSDDEVPCRYQVLNGTGRLSATLHRSY